jgi:hypothetical protein
MLQAFFVGMKCCLELWNVGVFFRWSELLFGITECDIRVKCDLESHERKQNSKIWSWKTLNSRNFPRTLSSLEIVVFYSKNLPCPFVVMHLKWTNVLEVAANSINWGLLKI